MRRVIKICSILLICLFMICGCNDNQEEYTPTSSDDPIVPETSLESNIKTSEVALFNGEFNDKTIVLKVRNDNNRPVYLNYSFEVFDKNKRKLYNKEEYVRVGSMNAAYVVAIQDLEESPFETYTYKMTVLDDELQDYDLIKDSIKSDYINDGKSIIVSYNNIGKRTTDVYGWLFFYNNNKLVAVKDAKVYNLTPFKTDSVSVTYPIKTVNKKIAFDRVELITNEVSTEL